MEKFLPWPRQSWQINSGKIIRLITFIKPMRKMTENIYIYSQLSSESVGLLAVLHYGLSEKLICKYYVLGLHDNYLIESQEQKYILRIYRNNWRSQEEILFELEWLRYLRGRTKLVVELVETKGGNLTFQVDSPEGPRLGAMFQYADGNEPGNNISANEAELLGEAVAYIHKCSDTYIPQRTRQVLNTKHLLDDSVYAISPYLDKEGIAYLFGLRDQLNDAMPNLEECPGIYGLCIGDVNPTNFHISEHDEITVFDFDQCGYGYRAFEIGKFFSSVRIHCQRLDVTEAFCRGYQSIRPLSLNERQAIPVFEIISVIWVMAIQVANADRIGYKYLEKQAWDRRLRDLKNLVSARSDELFRSKLNGGEA